jgi:hypothetical protein
MVNFQIPVHDEKSLHALYTCHRFLFATARSEESEVEPDPEIIEGVILQLDIDPDLHNLPDIENYSILITLEVGVQDKTNLTVVSTELEKELNYSLAEFFTDDVTKTYEVQFPVKKNSQQVFYGYNVTLYYNDVIPAGTSEYDTFEPSDTVKLITVLF